MVTVPSHWVYENISKNKKSNMDDFSPLFLLKTLRSQQKKTVPEDKIFGMENRYFDPSELGPAEMTTSSYKYSYESTCEPANGYCNNKNDSADKPGYSRSDVQGQSPQNTNFDTGFTKNIDLTTSNLTNSNSPPTKNVNLDRYDQNSTFVDFKNGHDYQIFDHQRADERQQQNGYLIVENDERVNVERQEKQTQKVTRVTKVTTTRTVQHLPCDQEGSMGDVEYRILSPGDYLDEHKTVFENTTTEEQQQLNTSITSSSYNTSPNYALPYDQRDHKDSPRLGVPSRPGSPQIVDIDSDRVTIVWMRPERAYGSPSKQPFTTPGTKYLGYQVQFRSLDDPQWYIANEDLIFEPLCTIENLNFNGEYEIRVVAKNSNGLSDPSEPTLVQLRPNKQQVVPTTKIKFDSDVPLAPGRPRILECDGTSQVVLAWEPPVFSGTGGPVMGYRVEYRVVSTSSWISATDNLVKDTKYTVIGLRPNGEYEFRTLAKNSDGYSLPSQISENFRIRPFSNYPSYPYSGASPSEMDQPPDPPSQPQVIDVDSDSATLIWAPGLSAGPSPSSSKPASKYSSPTAADRANLHFIVEFREVGDPSWYSASERPIFGTQYTVTHLHKNSTYEFRVFARNSKGIKSAPSEVSELCQLHPKIVNNQISNRQVPAQPNQPEIMNVVDDCVTLCWAPVRSTVPLQGYQVEFRDLTDSPETWLPVNAILTHSCKMTIGDLIAQREYEFRIIAKNAIGYSKPSEPSQPILIGFNYGSTPTTSQGPPPPPQLQQQQPSTAASPLQREYSFNNDVPLPVEMSPTKESPPITDTDDSPPPIRRKQPGAEGVTYRDPTLPEVLDYLSCSNNVLKLNASGYLQHLTYNDEAIKHKVRELDGIPRVIDLLKNEVPEIQKNACGCLRNLSFGIDENKKAILNAGGVPSLANLLKKSYDMQILEEISSVLWNLSSHDDLKTPILQQAVEPLIKQIVIPYSGWSSTGRFTDSRSHPPAVFRNSTGVLRNISSASGSARRTLRDREGLVDAMVHYLHMACDSGEVDTKSVENVICVIRNLSYRLQEIEDPNYDKNPPPASHRERSRSAPSSSPKAGKKKGKHKKADNGDRKNADETVTLLFTQPATGVALVWQPEVIRDYLKLLDQSTNPDTLEGSAGAIQNLAACYWKPSENVRTTVRTEKGLPILVTLLSLDNDKVVCAAATALRNLSLDQRNKELIGKYAMEDLVKKLPTANTAGRLTAPGHHTNASGAGLGHPSDDTVAAVLSVIYATTVRSPDFTRTLLEKGGVERLVHLSNSRQYSQRVAKYAAQVLFAIWQHRELHDAYKKASFREEDFVSRVNAGGHSRHADTLARPISTQGIERGGHKSGVRPDWDDCYSTTRSRAQSSLNVGPTSPQQETIDLDARTPLSASGSRLDQQLHRPTGVNIQEPTYAQVQKKGKQKQYAQSPSPGFVNGKDPRTPLLSQSPQQPLDSWV